MMMLDSGTVRSLASSRSTGNLPIGQIFLKAAADSSLNRSTMTGSNGVPFSYRAVSAFWQKDDSGWK
jgi:hypothetical protein